MNTFDTLKLFDGKKYSGMRIGGEHHWNYINTEWDEVKTEPDRWNVRMTSIKQRKVGAPTGSGAPTGTQYDWFLVGRQVVEKINENEYKTVFEAHKYKLGHKRPYWKQPSYMYKEQKSLIQMQLDALNREIREIQEEKKQENKGDEREDGK